MVEQALDIVLISTADWDNPFWTNKQHVAVELARMGHRVLYVESQGLRRPTVTGRDLMRIGQRLGRAATGLRRVRDRLWVWSPASIPFQSSSTIRALNRFILGSSLRFWMRTIGFRPDLLWTYSPLTTRLFNTDRFGLVVYHAVDNMKAQPGMPVAAIAEAEAELAERADLIFVTSRRLEETHSKRNPETHYFPNVADYDHFASARNRSAELPSDLAAIPRPRLGFVGAIASYKLDFALLQAVAAARKDWSIVLIGKVGEGDPWTEAGPLGHFTNIHLLGPREYSEIPRYMSGFDVGLLPNLLNDYTRSMFPMKFFEYLAAGLPVVATQLPALEEFGGVAALCRGETEFISAIQSVLSGHVPPRDARLAAARAHNYARRQAQMMSIVRSKLASRRRHESPHG